MEVKVHPTAIVSPRAEIGEGTQIGPFSIIEDGAVIGKRCVIGAYSCIYGTVRMGDENVIFPHASIGAPHQFLKYKDEAGEVIIGNRNTFREFTTVHPGTPEYKNRTVIGDENYFMIGVHIAHDCTVGSRNIFANLASLSGCVEVGDDVVFGGMSGVHQHVRIGSYAMVGGGTMIPMDVPPFCLAAGNRAELHGLNEVGLKRKGFSPERISKLRRAYRILFLSGLNRDDAIRRARDEVGGEDVEFMIDFIISSKRGILKCAR